MSLPVSRSRLARSSLASLALLFALGACAMQPQAASAPAPEGLRTDLVMRSYEVPRAYAAEAQNVLGSLLYRGKDTPRAGNVALSPSGQLLVAAPEAFHEGVVAMLAQMKKPGASEPPPAVEMDYWIVLGRPADETVIPKALAGDAAPALRKLVEEEGAMEFALLDRLKLQSASGDKAQVSSPFYEVEQVATLLDDKVLANIRLFSQRGPGNVSVRTQLATNQLLVLGEAGHELKPDEPFWQATDKREARPQVTAFYIVRARLAGE